MVKVMVDHHHCDRRNHEHEQFRSVRRAEAEQRFYSEFSMKFNGIKLRIKLGALIIANYDYYVSVMSGGKYKEGSD